MKILITGGLGHIGSYLLENIYKILGERFRSQAYLNAIRIIRLYPESIPKNESNPTEAQGSALQDLEDNLTQSLNRKVDYHIQQESNEVVVKIRDGETGEIIRQIPEEEFLRLTNRISDFNENILDEIV